MLARHVVSNSFTTVSADPTATVVAYITTYQSDDGQHHHPPTRIDRPIRLSVVETAMRLNGDGWRITAMEMSPQFEFVDSASNRVREAST